MFWIGFCAGVSAAFLICLGCLFSLTFSVAKDRKIAREKPDIAPALVKYWETANARLENHNKNLCNILSKITDKI